MVFSTLNKLSRNLLILASVILISAASTVLAQEITPIDSLKMNDADGVTTWDQAPSVNVTGVVTSTVQTGTGTAGPSTIQNAHTGIAVYGNFMAKDGGIKIGDSVIVLDVKVMNYNGLTELSYNSTSSVQIISSNHVVNPVTITMKQTNTGWNSFEKYESMFVTIKNVTFIDTATTFTLGTSTTGWNYYISDGVDTMIFRITKNVPDIIGTPVPKTPVNVTGILSQYDKVMPYDAGYQIFPLSLSSISPVTAIENEPEVDFSYELFQNYPNPFNPTTNISFSLPASQKVELAVYDIMGRKVQTLYNSVAQAGITNVTFNGSNLSSGVYFYSIKTADRTITKKLILMK